MARKKNSRKKNSSGFDPLGGFSLEQLLGLNPISEPKKKSIVSKVIGLPVMVAKAPVKIVQLLLGGIFNAIMEIVKLPGRVLSGLIKPWRRS